jgi:DNA-directed RNA polymerase subunit alpha
LCGGIIQEAVAEKLGHPVSKLELSKRASNALFRNGIRDIEQILTIGLDRLLRLRNIGVKTADEIKSKIKTLGLGCFGEC